MVWLNCIFNALHQFDTKDASHQPMQHFVRSIFGSKQEKFLISTLCAVSEFEQRPLWTKRKMLKWNSSLLTHSFREHCIKQLQLTHMVVRMNFIKYPMDVALPGYPKQLYCFSVISGSLSSIMLGLHRITTNLGPIYELKNSEFLGLVSSR